MDVKVSVQGSNIRKQKKVPGSGGRSLSCGLQFVSLLRGYTEANYSKKIKDQQTEFKITFTKSSIQLIKTKQVVMQPPPFTKINTNSYLTKKAIAGDLPVQQCNCYQDFDNPINFGSSTRRPSSNLKDTKTTLRTCKTESNHISCGENCINRMMFIECTPEICSQPDSSRCGNRQFQRRVTAKMQLKYLKSKGFGLVAIEQINIGDFLIEYVGEVIDDVECEKRMMYSRSIGERHFYMMEIERDVVIDARYKSNNARFINHSCDPNCQTLKWNVNGEIRVGIFALLNIEPGTEITIDYKFHHFSKEIVRCHCGSSNCSGIMGSKKELEASKVLANGQARSNIRLYKPKQLSSLVLLKSSYVADEDLFSSKFNASSPFIAHNRKKGVNPAKFKKIPNEYVPKLVSWYKRVASKVPTSISHRCGGIFDWTSEISCLDLSSYSNPDLEKKTLVLTCGRNLFVAREKRFQDMQSFAQGKSKWNRRFPFHIDDQVSEMIDRLVTSARVGGFQDNGKYEIDPNEDTCYRCGQAGELICCDSCPAAFHVSCAGLLMIPGDTEKWFCGKCKQKRKVNSMVATKICPKAGQKRRQESIGKSQAKRKKENTHQ